MYGVGAAMGFSPRDVDELTAWEFNAAAEGYRKANTAEGEGDVKPPTAEEHAAMMARFS